MANSNFIVQNGLTVGPLTIDATTGNITTSGAINSTNTGPTTFSGNLVVSGNLQVNGTTTTVNQQTINTSLVDAGTLSVAANATVNALTVNLSTTIGGTLGVTGNINGTSATLSGSMVTTGPAQHLGGLQATPIGNTAPSTALFTTVGASSNVTASALTVNNSATIGGTLGVTGNINGTMATLSNSATIGSTLGVTGNINGSSLTLTGSQVTTGSAQYLGGLQATPIGNTAPSTALFTTVSASSNVTASALTVNGSATIGGTLGVTGATTTAAITASGTVQPNANATVNLGGTSNWWNNVYGVTFIGVATTAKYADLAENYLADDVYAPGTVVVFGGDQEITITNNTHDTRVAGVVSTNPAYLMNGDLANATPVAFTGRVPCRVMGPVTKGQLLVQGMNWGIAEALNPDYFAPGCVLGKSLEEITDNSIQTIEIVVGRF